MQPFLYVRCSGLMVNALDSDRSISLDLAPAGARYRVLEKKEILRKSIQVYKWVPANFMLWWNAIMDWYPVQVGRNTPSHFTQGKREKETEILAPASSLLH